MKTVLKIFIGLTLLVSVGLIIYAGWFIGEATSDFPTLEAEAVPGDDRLDVRMTLQGTDRPVAITSISLPRSVQDSLGLGPPEGFVEAPLPHDSSATDPESRQFVDDFNAENVRYVGRFPLDPDEERTLRFPATDPDGGQGRIDLEWERPLGVGGSGGFFRVLVNLDP